MRLLCFKKGVFGMDFTLPPLLTAMVDRGNGLLWGSVLIYLLIGAGLYFTVMTRAIQIRYFGHMFKLLRGSRQSNGGVRGDGRPYLHGAGWRPGRRHLHGRLRHLRDRDG